MNRRKFFAGLAAVPVTVAAATAATARGGEAGYFVTETALAELERAHDLMIEDLNAGLLAVRDAYVNMRADPITEAEFDAL